MTKSEVAQLLDLNYKLYKVGQKSLTPEDVKAQLDVWFYHFRKYPAENVKAAFLAANAVCAFPIQPADIFRQLSIAESRNQPSAVDDWMQIAEAVRKAQKFVGWRRTPMIVGVDKATGRLLKSDGTAELRNLFDTLPENAKAWLCNENVLRELTALNDEELNSFRRNEFLQFVKSRKSMTRPEYAISGADSPLQIGGAK